MIPPGTDHFNKLYEAHKALAAVEQQQEPHADDARHAQNSENLEKFEDLKAKKLNPDERVEAAQKILNEAWEICRRDPGGKSEAYLKCEQSLLHTIRNCVMYYTGSGTPINWEANTERVLKSLQIQLAIARAIPECFPQTFVSLLEQDIAQHQDQFSSTFYDCAKGAVYRFSMQMRELAQLASIQALESERKPFIYIRTPIQDHAIDCVTSFGRLRGKVEEIWKTKKAADQTIDNPRIKELIITFAESFKRVKDIGMEISAKEGEKTVAIMREALQRAAQNKGP